MSIPLKDLLMQKKVIQNAVKVIGLD